MFFAFAFQRNEYIFSLMEPKKVDKRAAEEKEEEDSGEREKKQLKNNEGSGRIILGLRFSRNRLHFLFKGHGGVIEHWVFRGTLADNQWHTLVLAVGSQHIRLTVDCSSPQEM